MLQLEREGSTLNSNVKAVFLQGLCRTFSYLQLCKNTRNIGGGLLSPVISFALVAVLGLPSDSFVSGGRSVTLCHLQSHCSLMQGAQGKDLSWLCKAGNTERD